MKSGAGGGRGGVGGGALFRERVRGEGTFQRNTVRTFERGLLEQIWHMDCQQQEGIALSIKEKGGKEGAANHGCV